MRLHRYYVGDIRTDEGILVLHGEFWLKDQALVRQFTKVMRYKGGSQLILFDGRGVERVYEVTEVDQFGMKLKAVSDMQPLVPMKEVHLVWALLKKDKNDWVLQKCTELGITHFQPIITERTEKTGFDVSRAHKIVLEAAEQCGRHDIPTFSEPVSLKEFIAQVSGIKLYVAEVPLDDQQVVEIDKDAKVAIIIGPEGGFTDQERAFFVSQDIEIISLSQFVFRAETACIAAAIKAI